MSSFSTATGTTVSVPANSLFVRFTPVTGGFNFISYLTNTTTSSPVTIAVGD